MIKMLTAVTREIGHVERACREILAQLDLIHNKLKNAVGIIITWYKGQPSLAIAHPPLMMNLGGDMPEGTIISIGNITTLSRLAFCNNKTRTR
jgi:hypothetical protein